MAFHPKAGSGSESVTKSVAEDALAGGGPAQGGVGRLLMLVIAPSGCDCGVGSTRAKMAGDGSSG